MGLSYDESKLASPRPSIPAAEEQSTPVYQAPPQQRFYLRSAPNQLAQGSPATPDYSRGSPAARPASAPYSARRPAVSDAASHHPQQQHAQADQAPGIAIAFPQARPSSPPRGLPEGPARGHTNLEYTHKPIGDPPVTELNPKTPSQNVRLKHRAASLIQRYAGNNWQTAQRTKWMLDVVTHIDRDYRSYILDQATQIQQLQQQIELMQSTQAGALHLAQAKAEELEELARQQQGQLRDAHATVLDLQTRLLESEAALGVAEQAAQAAAAEMGALHQAVSAITEHDARARKALSNRAHELKEALRGSQARCRHSTEQARRHNVEVAAMLRLKDEKLAQELANMSSEFTSQIAAVHQVERAAAQVEVAKTKMELDAYKEPWVYAYGRRSPTANKEVAAALNLIPSAGRVLLQTPP